MGRTQGQIGDQALSGQLARRALSVNLGTFIDEANPTVANHPSAPSMLIDYNGGVLQTNQRHAIYQFDNPISSIRAIIIPTTGVVLNPQVTVTSGVPSVTFNWEFASIRTAFDITTVTWATRPTGFGLKAFSVTYSPDLDQAGDTEVTTHLAMLRPNDSINTFYGFYIRPVSMTGVNITDYDLPVTTLPAPATTPGVVFPTT